MTHRISSDRAAAVSPNVHWIPIERETPPRGVKLQLIDRKRSGVAVYSIYLAGSDWTHWAPLPTFKKD